MYRVCWDMPKTHAYTYRPTTHIYMPTQAYNTYAYNQECIIILCISATKEKGLQHLCPQSSMANKYSEEILFFDIFCKLWQNEARVRTMPYSNDFKGSL